MQPAQDSDMVLPFQYSVNPLPDDLRTYLLPIAVMSLVSLVSTVGLFCFITYRMIAWRTYYHTSLVYNQYLLLMYNLFLAEIHQSIAFLLSFYWISQNKIEAYTAACFMQGWLVQVGDVGSGIWVLSIAIHTWYSLYTGRRLKHIHFCCCLVAIWVFIFVLATSGLIAHPKDYFVSTGGWCWINEKYDNYRLYLHFLWILLAQFGSVVIYASLFLLLRRNAKRGLPASNSSSSRKIKRAALFMAIYPTVYICFSLPLLAGRLARWNGRDVPLIYFCCGAALMTSSGFIDTIMYTLTRRVLVKEIRDDSNSSQGSKQETAAGSPVEGDKIGSPSRMKHVTNSPGNNDDVRKVVKFETHGDVRDTARTEREAYDWPLKETDESEEGK